MYPLHCLGVNGKNAAGFSDSKSPQHPALVLGVRSVGTVARRAPWPLRLLCHHRPGPLGVCRNWLWGPHRPLCAAPGFLQLCWGGRGWQELWAPGPALGRFPWFGPVLPPSVYPALPLPGGRARCCLSAPPWPCAHLYPVLGHTRPSLARSCRTWPRPVLSYPGRQLCLHD